MPTQKQKRLAKNIIKNSQLEEPENKEEMLKSVGYAVTTAEHNQNRTIAQKGVQKYLIEQGFSSDNAKRVVSEILNEGEDQHRLKASDMIFKIHGDYAPEKKITLNIQGDFDTVKEHEELRMKYEQELKDKLERDSS